MCIEFPSDPTSWSLDRQFMLGSSLIVAPVFEEDGSVEFYLPEGRWTSFISGEVKEGPRWIKEVHRLDSVPLYVREGTVLPLRAENGEVSLKAYGIKAGEVWKVEEIVEGALKEREVTVDEAMLAINETKVTVDEAALAPKEEEVTVDEATLAPKDKEVTVDEAVLA
jgi:alpha-glucosidase (family GH31 glycosyl hydrolase)